MKTGMLDRELIGRENLLRTAASFSLAGAIPA